MDEKDRLSNLVNTANEEFGGERVQPYMIILSSIVNAIENDLASE